MENNVFNEILMKDEVIYKTLKPSKKRFIIYPFLLTFIACSIFIICCLIIALLIYIFPGEDGAQSNFIAPLYTGLAFFIIMLIVMGLQALLLNIKYKNTYYAVTNKRVLIRTGIIGITYSSLKIETIATINVISTWMDRLFKTNAGDVYFYSSSAPVVNLQQGNKMANYAFMSIEEPYKVYKDVNDFIETIKNNNKNK